MLGVSDFIFCLSPVLEVTMQRPCLAASRHEPSCPRIAQVDTEKDEETHKSTGAASEDLTYQGLVGNKGIFYIKIVLAFFIFPHSLLRTSELSSFAGS